MKKTLLLSFIICLLLTACGQPKDVIVTHSDDSVHSSAPTDPTKQTSSSPDQSSMEEIEAFQNQYHPIVQSAIHDIFTDQAHFKTFGTYYIDNEKRKFVFLMNQLDVEEVLQLQKLLTREMGEVAEFVQSKYSEAELDAIQAEVVHALTQMKLEGGWSAGTDIKRQKIEISAYLTQEQHDQLIEEFGSDVVDIQISGIITDMIGYVVQVIDGKTLVVSPDVENYGANGGESYFYDAVWYSDAPSTIQIGQKVEVKVIEGPVTLPYPGNNVAEEVIVLPGLMPEEATMSEDEAIRQALDSHAYRESVEPLGWLPVVKATEYDPEGQLWTVHLTNTGTDQVVSIEIEE